ncbi:MAG: hypothetical protein R2735_16080 [Microthrixaceae bacterium]
MPRRSPIALIFGVLGALTLAAPTPTSAESIGIRQSEHVLATFEGTTINLTDGWGQARACFSDIPGTARCYRTEAAMDIAEDAGRQSHAGPWPLASCSSTVRLYRGTNYTGGVLALSTRYTYLNLAAYGFDNDTSSYKIGACSARFYDTTSGSGLYPGNTGAGASSWLMVLSWDNRIGSIYIN